MRRDEIVLIFIFVLVAMGVLVFIAFMALSDVLVV